VTFWKGKGRIFEKISEGGGFTKQASKICVDRYMGLVLILELTGVF
jgi:hypothetical protein